MRWSDVSARLLALPGTEEGTCYGTPAVRVGGKLLARLREDGVQVAVAVGGARDELLASGVAGLSCPAHYAAGGYVVADLDAVDPAELAEILLDTWRGRAPRRVVERWDLEHVAVEHPAGQTPEAGRPGAP